MKLKETMLTLAMAAAVATSAVAMPVAVAAERKFHSKFTDVLSESDLQPCTDCAAAA